MNIRKKAIHGVRWTGLSSIGSTVIKLIQLAILAHYLSTTDFGLMAIVGVIVGWSTLFLDFGINAAIIHKQNITNTQLSSLYWLNVLVGILLFLFIYSVVPIIAVFYESSLLVPLVRLLAVTFIISGLGNQFSILLQKNFKFKLLALRNLLGVLVGFGVALFLAMDGYGVYALVYSSIATTLVNTGLNIFWGIKFYRPKFTFNWAELDSIISFGFFQMGERTVNYITSQFDVLLIGKLLGTDVLGVYSIAKNISMKPYQIINPIVNKVTFPIMSKIQDDENRLNNIFLQAINYLCSINFPVYILIILLADGIILTFFGEKWVDAIIILQILSAYRMFTSFGNPIGTLLLAKGRADLGFYWNLALFGFIPLVIYLGSFWGVTGIAMSLLGLQVLLFYPAWLFLLRPLSKVSLQSYVSTIFNPLGIALLGGLVGYMIVWLFGIDDFRLRVVVHSLAMGSVVYMLNKKYNQDFTSVILELLKK